MTLRLHARRVLRPVDDADMPVTSVTHPALSAPWRAHAPVRRSAAATYSPAPRASRTAVRRPGVSVRANGRPIPLKRLRRNAKGPQLGAVHDI